MVVEKFVSPIAVPLVGGKLESKVLKCLKKAHGAKAIRRGVPEVTKLIRKGKKGVVIFAADVFPVDLIAHLPVLCEENDVLYCYVKSRQELGEAISSKRAVSVAFVPLPDGDSPYNSVYAGVIEGLKIVHPYMGQGKAMEDDEEGAEKTEKSEKKSKKRSADIEEATEPVTEEPAKKKKKKEKKEE